MAVYYTLWSQGPATKHFGPKSQQPYTSGYKGRSSQPATYPSSYSEVPLMLRRVAACHGIHRSNNIGYFWWINHRIRLVICAIESYETWRNINILWTLWTHIHFWYNGPSIDLHDHRLNLYNLTYFQLFRVERVIQIVCGSRGLWVKGLWGEFCSMCWFIWNSDLHFNIV